MQGRLAIWQHGRSEGWQTRGARGQITTAGPSEVLLFTLSLVSFLKRRVETTGLRALFKTAFYSHQPSTPEKPLSCTSRPFSFS